MGTLTDIGVLSGGEIGTGTKTAFRDQVVVGINAGISIGSLTLLAGQVSLGDFETENIDYVKEKYPAWYAFYIDGLLTGIANVLDVIPDAGILKVVGFFDPTKPILMIIVELKELIEQISSLIAVPLLDLLISNLAIVLAKATEIVAALDDAINAIVEGIDPLEFLEKFFEIIKEVITDVLNEAGEAVEPVIEQLDEQKETIISKLQEIVQKIIDSINLSLPSLSLPEFKLDFIDVNLTPPLLAVKEVDGYDGIVTKFIKLMTAFITIPAEIIESISSVLISFAEAASEAIQKIVSAVSKIITDIQGAIQELFNALLDFVWQIISTVIDIAEVAFLEISSIINIVIYFVKFFIISLLGFLIGSGLIVYSVAQILEVI